MDFQELQQTLWIHQPEVPRTSEEALSRVSQSLVGCIQAFQRDELVSAQANLEDTLAQVLIAMKTLNIEPDKAISRAITRMDRAAMEPRVFHIYRDRVEIQVGQEFRGGWPLYSNDDYEAALALARTFSCEIRYYEARQLNLFKAPRQTTARRTRPTNRHRSGHWSTSSPKPRLTLVANNPAPSLT